MNDLVLNLLDVSEIFPAEIKDLLKRAVLEQSLAEYQLGLLEEMMTLEKLKKEEVHAERLRRESELRGENTMQREIAEIKNLLAVDGHHLSTYMHVLVNGWLAGKPTAIEVRKIHAVLKEEIVKIKENI